MVVLLLIDGVAFGVIGPLTYVIYQERIPAELRGRVFGSISALHRLARRRACSLQEQHAIEIFSLTSALAAIALLSLAMPIIVTLAPSYREWSARSNH